MSVTKNYLYNLAYQILLIILPIITVPYITRTLGSEGVGINAFTNSNIQYFILFGTLGIALYGNRTVAYVRDNKDELNNVFWCIFFLKLITTSIAYVIFIAFLILSKNKYVLYYLLQSINIIAAAVDISWFFMGVESFKKITTRNFIIKIISLIMIFTLVKSAKDLWIYIFISVMSNLLGQLIMWLYIPKTFKLYRIFYNDIRKHLYPAIKLFIPTVATQVYCVFDKSFLGYMSNVNEVGIYDMGQKIVYLALTIVTSMGVVMLPKMTNTFSKGDNKKTNEYLIKSFNFASYISIPMMLGLMGISKGFSIWFFGKEFIKSSSILFIESPILVLIGWSNVIGVQYMLPLGKSNEYTISVTVGAIVDIISNLILIKYLFSIGAAISTVIAEFSVIFTQMLMMKKSLPFREMYHDIWKYTLSGLVMYISISILNIFCKYNLITTMIQIIFGILVYIIMLAILKCCFQKRVINLIKMKFRTN